MIRPLNLLRFMSQGNFLKISILISLTLWILANEEVMGQNSPIVLKEFIYDSASFPQCHASTIAETPEGLVAAWFGGTAERNPDVEIWSSRKSGDHWSAPVSVANGIQSSGKRYPCWNPVLFQVPGGNLLLFYKVGPSPDKWWGEMKTSTDFGRSWSPAVKLPDGILGPIKDKPILLDNGVILCGSSTENHGWQVHFEMTPDLGRTWTSTGPLNNGRKLQVIQPTILYYTDGRLQALCRSREGEIMTTWSADSGKSWSGFRPAGLPNPNSGIDAVTLKNGIQLVIYNHVSNYPGKDGGPRTPLNVAISKDGTNWFAVSVLEDTPGEFSYPAVIQTRDNLIHITYTWKRKRIRHVVLDPARFNPRPIVNQKWP